MVKILKTKPTASNGKASKSKAISKPKRKFKLPPLKFKKAPKKPHLSLLPAPPAYKFWKDVKMYDLPVVDLNASRDTQLKQIKFALSEIGFFWLEGVAHYEPHKLFQAIRWFYALPQAVRDSVVKNHWNKANKNQYRGLIPVPKNDPSFKENFEYGIELFDEKKCEGIPLYEKNPWPNGDASHPFAKLLLNYSRKNVGVGNHLMSLIAELFGLPSDYFYNWFNKSSPNDPECSLSTTRLLHYPMRKKTEKGAHCVAKDGTILITPEHADRGFFTFLCTFNYPGL